MSVSFFEHLDIFYGTFRAHNAELNNEKKHQIRKDLPRFWHFYSHFFSTVFHLFFAFE